jgi:glycerophosphoryl diester phosphodiesterase
MRRGRKPLVIGHRGAAGLAPENTPAAFRQAISVGVDYVELDVRLTKGGGVIAMHDETVDRTTDGRGQVESLTLRELKKLDAGSWFDRSPVERVPTLRQVIRLVRGKAKLNIEIKHVSRSPELTGRVVEILISEKFHGSCLITSFDPQILYRVKQLAGDIPVGLLLSERPSARHFNGFWEVLSCFFAVVDEGVIQMAVSAQKAIHVWTVNEPEWLLRFIRWDVDGIITDFPDRLTALLNR